MVENLSYMVSELRGQVQSSLKDSLPESALFKAGKLLKDRDDAPPPIWFHLMEYLKGDQGEVDILLLCEGKEELLKMWIRTRCKELRKKHPEEWDVPQPGDNMDVE